jgi:aminoglycoside phosphotransferase (APT) family kinase protein
MTSASTLHVGRVPDQDGAPPPRTPLWEFVEASGLRCLVVAASRNPNAKITVLLLPTTSDRPALAVKVPTTDGAARAVEAEARVLAALHERDSPMGETIPRPVDVVDFEGRPGIVLTAVAGIPMTSSYLRWHYTARRHCVAAHFAAVERWLAAFHSASANGSAALDMDGGVARRLADRFRDDAELERDLDRLDGIYTKLGKETVPRTAVHGDLWLGNVLLADGRVAGVVDWEDGAVRGEPVRDLVRFALMYALFLDRRTKPGRLVSGHRNLQAGRWGAGVEYALEGSGWFPELFGGFLRGGLARLGASPSLWHEAVLAGIAEVAAFTDDDDFARSHLALFRRLSRVRSS